MNWSAILRYVVTSEGCYSAMGETQTASLISHEEGGFSIATHRYINGELYRDRMKRIRTNLSNCTISMMVLGVGEPRNVLASCQLIKIGLEPQPASHPFGYQGKLKLDFIVNELKYCY